MLRSIFLFLVLIGPVIATCPAQALEIANAVITTGVVDREPVDQVKVFPRQNGKLYCFTRVVGAEDTTVVYHLWYRDEVLMSRVELPVKSPNWRTWSAKQFLEDWPGQWRVEIQDAAGAVIKTLEFELR